MSDQASQNKGLVRAWKKVEREQRCFMRNPGSQEGRRQNPGEVFATDCRDNTDKAGDKIFGQAEKFLVLVGAHRCS